MNTEMRFHERISVTPASPMIHDRPPVTPSTTASAVRAASRSRSGGARSAARLRPPRPNSAIRSPRNPSDPINPRYCVPSELLGASSTFDVISSSTSMRCPGTGLSIWIGRRA